MSLWKLYYHVVFGTKNRSIVLAASERAIASRLLQQKAEHLGCIVHAVNVQPDHAHVALSIPPTRQISSVVG